MNEVKFNPGDAVLCDPEFSPEHLKENKKPNCRVPAIVMAVYASSVLVEIIDENKGNKRIYTNTDLYGSTRYVLIQALEKTKAV